MFKCEVARTWGGRGKMAPRMLIVYMPDNHGLKHPAYIQKAGTARINAAASDTERGGGHLQTPGTRQNLRPLGRSQRENSQRSSSLRPASAAVAVQSRPSGIRRWPRQLWRELAATIS